VRNWGWASNPGPAGQNRAQASPADSVSRFLLSLIVQIGNTHGEPWAGTCLSS
jgi:hypothetical protein